MVKKGTAAKKATVTQKLESGVRAKIVALRPSTITNRARIYAASPGERLAEWKDGSAGKWCMFRRNDVIDEAWLVVRRSFDVGRLRWQRSRHGRRRNGTATNMSSVSIAGIGATMLRLRLHAGCCES
jgi:hypothetical protein